jgi:hypothetical protein
MPYSVVESCQRSGGTFRVDKFHRNVGDVRPGDTASHPRRLSYSCAPISGPQIAHTSAFVGRNDDSSSSSSNNNNNNNNNNNDDDDIQKLDRKSRKMLIRGHHHPRTDIDNLYLHFPRKE